MKICKDCKEPKFNFQMYKKIWVDIFSPPGVFYSERIKYCKKCIKKRIFEMIKRLK